MKIKSSTFLLAIAVLIFISTDLINAQGYGRRGGGRGWYRGNYTARRLNLGRYSNFDHYSYRNVLNLTDEQEKRIDRLNDKFDDKEIDLYRELDKKRLDLQHALNESGKEKVTDDLIDEIGDIRAKIQKNEIQFDKEVREILTHEQRKLLDDEPLFYGRRYLNYRRNFGCGAGVRYNRRLRDDTGYYFNRHPLRNYPNSVRLGRGPCGSGLGRFRNWW